MLDPDDRLAANLVDAAIAVVDNSQGRNPTFITPCYGYGAQSNVTIVAPVSNPDTRTFHIIQPAVVYQRS